MENRSIQITSQKDIIPKKVSTHQPYEFEKYQVTEDYSENQCCVAVYELSPQKSNYPYHYHMSNEEVFYIVRGNGTLETPDGDRPVSKGDFIVCPPGPQGAHKLTNSSFSEQLVYINFDAVHSPEVVIYPHSDKVGFITHGATGSFYKRNENVPYYDGE